VVVCTIYLHPTINEYQVRLAEFGHAQNSISDLLKVYVSATEISQGKLVTRLSMVGSITSMSMYCGI